MHISKKDESEDAEPWVRLLKDKHQEKGQVSIDWNKWVDEDDEPEGGNLMDKVVNGGPGFGMPGMGGPAMDNMAEMMKQYGNKPEEEEEYEDSDDEIPPVGSCMSPSR